MASHCSGTNKDGEPCSAYVDAGQSWCRWHDPARESDRAEWRRKGGTARSNQSRARRKLAGQGMTLSAVDAVLCGALRDVLDGTLEPGVGVAAATIAKAISAVRVTAGLEDRIGALEGQAGIDPGRRVS